MSVSASETAAQITAARPVRAVATALAAVFTAIGWLAAKICTLIAAVFLAAGWLTGLCAKAVIYGFQQGMGTPPRTAEPPPPAKR